MSNVRFLCLALILVPSCVWSAPAVDQPDCKHPASMAEMTVCSKLELVNANGEMDKAYKQVIVKIDADSRDQSMNRRYEAALKASQDAWLRFRDADCAFSNFDREGGSSQAMNIYGCRSGLTEARTKELLAVLNSM